MNFSNIIRQKNKLLIPFSLLYKAGIYIYHCLYNWGIKKSFQPPLPTICVGNLSVGGTGKSPMVEYLLNLLSGLVPLSSGEGVGARFQVAVVSRGYKRKTRGFVRAQEGVTADDIGDEPMQFYKKFPGATIVVDEKRAEGINRLLQQNPEIGVIILDDAFQHRRVKAGLNILLTEYNNIFTTDRYLPAGSLRDLKSAYKRADLIIVTKTNRNITATEKQKIIDAIRPLSHQKLYFTDIGYDAPYNVSTKQNIDLETVESIILITGIANPVPLLNYLKQFPANLVHLEYPDHHSFSQKDIGDILGTYHSAGTENRIILTTEKDAVRLMEWKELLAFPVFALPVRHEFLFNKGDDFDQMIRNYLMQQ